MSVLTDYFSIVIRIENIIKKYPGGIAQYEKDCPNATFCKDEHLARVGFMAWDDFQIFYTRLRELFNFEMDEIGPVSQFDGLTSPKDWLEFYLHDDGLAFCCLKGTEPGELAVPSYWTIDEVEKTKEMYHASPDESELIGQEKDYDVYQNKQTGQLLYIARTQSVNTTFKEGTEYSSDQIKNLIIGKWDFYTESPELIITGISCYNKDNTFWDEIVLLLDKDENNKRYIELSGTWNICETTITHNITKSSIEYLVEAFKGGEYIKVIDGVSDDLVRIIDKYNYCFWYKKIHK